MTPRDEAISKAVQDAIKIWKNKYDKAMARAMEAEMEMTRMEEIQEDNIDYESQLRDQFAIAAMNSITASLRWEEIGEAYFEDVVKESYKLADLMMQARKE